MRYAALLVLASGCGVVLDFDPQDPRADGGGTGSDMSALPDLGTRDALVADMPMRDAFVADLPTVDAVVADLPTIDAVVIDLPTTDAIMPDLSARDAGPDFAIVDLGLPDLIATTPCGLAGAGCAAGEYCAVPPGVCLTSTMGTCMVMPAGCGGVVAPVCGCDDATYSNACLASAAGVNVAHSGPCACRSTIDCCCSDLDCTATDECAGDLLTGGTCHSHPPTGQCWTNGDCGGGVCHGAMICPCGVSCFAPDVPGSCG